MNVNVPNVFNARAKQRVAIVVASPAVSTTTGWPVGLWWSELTKGSDGDHIARSKTVTGFANVEEDVADNTVWSCELLPRDEQVMPWRFEDRLKQVGANDLQARLWRGFAVRAGNLIAGQQTFSGGETARLVVEALRR